MVAEPAGSNMYSRPSDRWESTGSREAIPRNRDGVPMWSGDPALLEEFAEACLRYEQTVVREKRYLCGPRIASELSGPAKRVLLGRPADWLSYDGGVRRLLEELRVGRGQPKVPEMSELLMKYFKGTKRTKGEGMSDYVTRKAEAYTRAQQSMARYLQEQKTGVSWSTAQRTSVTGGPSQSGGSHSGGPENSWDGGDDEDRWEAYSQAGSANTAQQVPTQEPPEALVRREEEHQQNWWHQRGWYDDQYRGWYHGQGWRGSEVTYDTTEWGRGQLPEIVPAFVQGWYLFIDSGLDVMERNVLQAELRGDFSVQAVEDVLRKHWPDVELKRRDAEKSKFFSNLADAEDTSDDWACWGDENPEQLEAEGYSAEEIECLMSEQQAQKEALAAIQEARRTLRDARARQHAVRTARQFYPVKGGRPMGAARPSTSDGKGGPMKCFRCGGPHKIANCPERPRESANVTTTMEADEQATFIFLTEHVNEEHEALVSTTEPVSGGPALTTAEVVEAGKAVIDGGATRSIGSTYALNRVLELNEAKYGSDGLKSLDMEDRPAFGFGNSSRERCVSTANLNVPWNNQEGMIKVHALDKGTSPILLSIHSLRKLGAVIAFESNYAVFRSVDPCKLIQLEQSAAGHQVLPLTDDVFKDATVLGEPVPSFADLC